jgi:hypothetical protein
VSFGQLAQLIEGIGSVGELDDFTIKLLLYNKSPSPQPAYVIIPYCSSRLLACQLCRLPWSGDTLPIRCYANLVLVTAG